MPGGGGWPRFCLPVADDAGDDQIRVIHRSAEGRAKRVAQFAALMNGAGDAGIEMAGKAAGPGETPDKLFQSLIVKGQFRIEMGNRPLQVEVGQVGRRTMPWSRDQKHIQLVASDEMVEVRIHQVDAGTGSPVAQQAILDIFRLERLPQQGIAFQVNLCCRQVIGDAAETRYGVQFLPMLLANLVYGDIDALR